MAIISCYISGFGLYSPGIILALYANRHSFIIYVGGFMKSRISMFFLVSVLLAVIMSFGCGGDSGGGKSPGAGGQSGGIVAGPGQGPVATPTPLQGPANVAIGNIEIGGACTANENCISGLCENLKCVAQSAVVIVDPAGKVPAVKPDPIAKVLSVIKTSPAKDGNVPINIDSIIVQFDAQLDEKTVTKNTFKVSIKGEPVVASRIELIPQDQTNAAFILGQPLVPNSVYNVEVTKNIASVDGIKLAENFGFSFTTTGINDNVKPTVTNVSVVGQKDLGRVPCVPQFSVTFSEPMAPQSMDNGVYLSDVAGEFVALNQVSVKDQTYTYDVKDKLTANQTYHLIVNSSVKDLAGNSMGAPFSSNDIKTVAACEPPEVNAPAPRVISTKPANDEVVDLLKYTGIAVCFNEEINVDTLAQGFSLELMKSNPTSISIDVVTYQSKNQDHCAILENRKANANGDVVTGKIGLNSRSSYRLTINTNIMNVAGIALAQPVIVNFKTGEAPVGPKIVNTIPATGAVKLALKPTIKFFFDKAMNENSLLASVGEITHSDGRSIFATIKTPVVGVDGTIKEIDITPKEKLPEKENFSITVAGEVRDTDGIMMGEQYKYQFSTGPKFSVVMATSDNQVAERPKISFFFSNPLNENSAKDATSFIDEDGGRMVVAYEVQYPGEKTLTITPSVNLEAQKAYAITIGAAVEDLAGNTLGQDYVYRFNTGGAQQAEPPPPQAIQPTVLLPIKLIESDPLDMRPRFQFTFSTTMAGTTQNILSLGHIFKNAQNVDVSYRVIEINKKTWQIRPDINLTPNSSYTITIPKTVETDGGVAMAQDYTYTFTATPPVGIEPLAVQNVARVENNPVDQKPSFLFAFNNFMNRASTVLTNGDIFKDASGAVIPYEVGIIGERLIAIIPKQDISPLKGYIITIKKEIQDVFGQTMGADYIYTFGDTINPTIERITPDFEADVQINAKILTRFSELIKHDTITQDSVYLLNTNTGEKVPASLSIENFRDQTQVKLIPNLPLQPGTQYKIVYDKTIEDLFGNKLDFVSKVFTTVPN